MSLALTLKEFATRRNAFVGILPETTQGTLVVSGDYTRLRASEVSLSAQETIITATEVGRATATDKRGTSAWVTGSITSPLTFADLDDLVRLGLRDDAMPSEVAAAVTVTLTGLPAPEIRVVGANGAFAALLASTSGADLEGMAVSIYGSAADDWDAKGHKVVLPGYPADDAADTVILLRPEDFQAASGFGSDWAGEVGVAVTVDAGASVRLNSVTPSGNPSHSMIIEYPDVAKYVPLVGVRFGPPTFAFTGRDSFGTITQTFVGACSGVVTDANPNSGGDIVDSLTYSPQIDGTEIENIYVGTATTGINLAGCAITSLTMGATGDWVPKADTLGSKAPCGYLSPIVDHTTTFTYSIDDVASATATAEALQTIGHPDTKEKAVIEVELRDKDGNVIRLAHTYGEPSFTTTNGAGGTGEAATEGEFTLNSHGRHSSTYPEIVFSRRALGVAET